MAADRCRRHRRNNSNPRHGREGPGATVRWAQGRGRGFAFFPDGTQIASGGADRKIRLWSMGGNTAAENLRSGVPEPLARNEWVRSVAFSPSGAILAGGGSDDVRFWSFDRKPAPKPLKHGSALGLVFSPEGDQIIFNSSLVRFIRQALRQGRREILHCCSASRGLGFINRKVLWLRLTDRFLLMSFPGGEPLGELS